MALPLGAVCLRTMTMPKGPNGQSRPADAIGCAVLVGRIATGEIDEIIDISGGKERRSAGGNARAAKLSPRERTAISSAAARARWGAHGDRQDETMTQTAAPVTGAGGREAVRMYPNNQLRQQVRGVEETLSAFQVVKNKFFPD